jgi:hypothetical protein
MARLAAGQFRLSGAVKQSQATCTVARNFRRCEPGGRAFFFFAFSSFFFFSFHVGLAQLQPSGQAFSSAACGLEH